MDNSPYKSLKKSKTGCEICPLAAFPDLTATSLAKNIFPFSLACLWGFMGCC
jgi:hypothetical protein